MNAAALLIQRKAQAAKAAAVLNDAAAKDAAACLQAQATPRPHGIKCR